MGFWNCTRHPLNDKWHTEKWSLSLFSLGPFQTSSWSITNLTDVRRRQHQKFHCRWTQIFWDNFWWNRLWDSPRSQLKLKRSSNWCVIGCSGIFQEVLQEFVNSIMVSLQSGHVEWNLSVRLTLRRKNITAGRASHADESFATPPFPAAAAPAPLYILY